MDEEPEAGRTATDTFNRDGLRTLADMRRSSDDRIVAGVCAGVARHLNLDPIVIRIAVVALTFVGLAGLILYLAAWFLIPSDDEEHSIAADWFKLDRNESQVRTVGLFIALVLAIAAAVGDNGWGLWWLAWVAIPVAFLYWLFAVRPRQRLAEFDAVRTDLPHVDSYTAEKTAQTLERKRQRLARRRESRALRGLTFSLLLIAEAVTLLVDRTVTDVPAGGYLAVALAVIGVGCLVGAAWGNARGLVFVGIVLTMALLVSSIAPSAPSRQLGYAPSTAEAVQSSYRSGAGDLVVDLSGVDRPAQLAGRTVTVDAALGSTTIRLPQGLPVELDVHLRAGEIRAFGRAWEGLNQKVSLRDGQGDALRVVVQQKLGEVEVSRR